MIMLATDAPARCKIVDPLNPETSAELIVS
jgi:hypothetical protein